MSGPRPARGWVQHARLAWLALAFISLMVSALPVRAEPTDEARILFEAGIAADRGERWREARDYFKRSASLIQKPNTLFNLAAVEVKLGLGLEALSTLGTLETIAVGPEYGPLLERCQALKREAEELARTQRSGVLVLSELMGVPNLEGEPGALFAAGHEAYFSGRYAQALEYFERAHELSKRPELLYNIGAAADRLRDDAKTLQALEAFLAANIGAPQVEAVRARVAVLQKLAKDRAQATSPPVRAEPPTRQADKLSSTAPSKARVWKRRGWWLLGSGLAAAGGSLGSYLGSRARGKTADECIGPPDMLGEATDLCKPGNQQKIRRQGTRLLPASIGFAVVAAALIPTGTVFLVRGRRTQVQPDIRADGFGLVLQQRF